MRAARVDVVELGFRLLRNEGFKGACAYTTDHSIRSLAIPEGLALAVMPQRRRPLGEMGLEAALQTTGSRERGNQRAGRWCASPATSTSSSVYCLRATG